MQVAAATLGFYEWMGRTIEAHRAHIREHLGFRVYSVAAAQKQPRPWYRAGIGRHRARRGRRRRRVGLDNAGIARRLFLADKTVRNRVSSVLGKLAVRTRAEAVVLAREHGLGVDR